MPRTLGLGVHFGTKPKFQFARILNRLSFALLWSSFRALGIEEGVLATRSRSSVPSSVDTEYAETSSRTARYKFMSKIRWKIRKACLNSWPCACIALIFVLFFFQFVFRIQFSIFSFPVCSNGSLLYVLPWPRRWTVHYRPSSFFFWYTREIMQKG